MCEEQADNPLVDPFAKKVPVDSTSGEEVAEDKKRPSQVPVDPSKSVLDGLDETSSKDSKPL